MYKLGDKAEQPISQSLPIHLSSQFLVPKSRYMREERYWSAGLQQQAGHSQLNTEKIIHFLLILIVVQKVLQTFGSNPHNFCIRS